MGFKALDQQDLIISADSVTSTVWSGNAPTLSTFYTSSAQTGGNSGLFYYNIYQTASADSTAAVQFSVAYCDKLGSGSAYYNSLVAGASPSRTNYGQYRTLVLGDENADFIFGNFTSSYFYALTIDRARYKEALLPGTMTLELSGSAGEIKLTDNSTAVSSVTFNDAGRVYQMVSGSAGTVFTDVNSNGYTANSGSYGLFLPDVGLILLNGSALDGPTGGGGIALATGRSANTNNTNPTKLFNALNLGANFTLNSKETLSSDYIFVRARNNEFNYSENPSFISGSTGEVIYSDFIENPTTYITSVGLYNNNNELLAVAKLSRPLKKDFTKELLVRVKLDF